MLVRIVCPARNRRVVVPDRDGDHVVCSQGNVAVFEPLRVVTYFVREEVNVPADGAYAAFRVSGTRNYLTAYPHGEGRRGEMQSILGRLRIFTPGLLEEIVNFALPSPFWDGGEFSNFPIRAERGPPNVMQIFRLVRTENGRTEDGGNCQYGIQTYDGSYLHCAPWAERVIQSPVMRENETWEILREGDEE